MPTVVQDNPGRRRYELLEEGRVVSVAEYHPTRDSLAFTHTGTDPAMAGRGLAHQLVEFALDDVRERGLAVLPNCPFVARVIAENPDRYLDLVPASERPRFGLPPTT